jgi:hypothetical protein
MTADPAPPDAHEPGRASRSNGQPNYQLRRALVGLAAVAVLAGAAVVALLVVRDTDDTVDDLEPAWNAVAVVDQFSGAVTVFGTTGEQTAALDGAGRVLEVHSRGARLALVGPAQITLAEAGGGDPLVVPVDRARTAARLPTNRSLTFVMSAPGGGNVVVIDGGSGAQLDIGAIAGQASPLLFAESLVADRDGRRFAVGDGRNFQTIVVDFDTEVATFYPGVPLALDDDMVITSTNIGNRAELGFFDTEGTRQGTVPTARTVGGVIDGERFVYVTVTGEVLAATAGDDEPDELGTLAVPAGDQVRWARPALDGQRLVVAGDRFWAVVDLEGTTLHLNTFTAEREALIPWYTWRCAPAGGSGGYQAIIDLDTGEVAADLDNADVTSVSLDGCGVEAVRDDTRTLVSATGRLELPPTTRSAVVSPDGRSAVVVDATGLGRLVTLHATDSNDGDGDPADTGGDDDRANDRANDRADIELGAVRGFVVFVDR